MLDIVGVLPYTTQMARLTKRHRLAIGRGLRRYWRRVKTTARTDNTSIRDARAKLKLARQEEERRKKHPPGGGPPQRGWRSPDPEGEVAFNLQDRDEHVPPFWTPKLSERFRGFSVVHIVGYWEYRASPQTPAVAEDFELEFDPGPTPESFWSYFFEAIRELHDETLEGIGGEEKYERFAIFVTRMY